MEARMRRRGQFLASRGSRRILVRDEFADVDKSSPWTVPDRTEFVDMPGSWPWNVASSRTFRVSTATDSRTQNPCRIKGFSVYHIKHVEKQIAGSVAATRHANSPVGPLRS